MLTCVWKMSQYEPKKILKTESFLFLTFLVIVCETFRELDAPKAQDNTSCYGVRLLKKNFVVSWVGLISE